MSYSHAFEVRYLESINDFSGNIITNAHWKIDTTTTEDEFCLMTQNFVTEVGGLEAFSLSKNEIIASINSIVGAEQLAFIQSEGERQVDELVIPIEVIA